MNIAGMRKLMQGLLRQRVQEYQQKKHSEPTDRSASWEGCKDTKRRLVKYEGNLE